MAVLRHRGFEKLGRLLCCPVAAPAVSSVATPLFLVVHLLSTTHNMGTLVDRARSGRPTWDSRLKGDADPGPVVPKEHPTQVGDCYATCKILTWTGIFCQFPLYSYRSLGRSSCSPPHGQRTRQSSENILSHCSLVAFIGQPIRGTMPAMSCCWLRYTRYHRRGEAVDHNRTTAVMLYPADFGAA
ncbi:hypothetical protein CGRA01v4_05091 [Colletotrichum graminicola]|nr:hypothetical protein CGRA01v4_05091 [Colletotrichum graminicola]